MVAIAEIPSNGGASASDCASCNPNHHCGNGLEKVYPTCAVRYGVMGLIGEFRYAPGMLFGCGQKVVIQTERGTEIGSQVSLTCSGCSKSVSREQIQTYVKNSGPDFMRLHAGRIVRAAHADDLAEDEKQRRLADEMLAECAQVARRLNLPLKPVTCEYLFGGERAVFYFRSEERVDFRELVRELAHSFHTRIEMRQVGARDEARLVADYEICGRECCCKSFLKTLRPVSMSMAKLQKATLDPSKVSGRCGRLRCCLRYEHEGYGELNKKLPRNGKRVRTSEGVGVIVDRQVLTQLLLVEFEDQRRITFAIEDILEVDVPLEAPDAARAATEQRPGRDERPARGERPRPDARDRRGRGRDRSEPGKPRDAGPPRGAGAGQPESKDASAGASESPNAPQGAKPPAAGAFAEGIAPPMDRDLDVVEQSDSAGDVIDADAAGDGASTDVGGGQPGDAPDGGGPGNRPRRRRRRFRGRGRRSDGPGSEGGGPRAQT